LRREIGSLHDQGGCQFGVVGGLGELDKRTRLAPQITPADHCCFLWLTCPITGRSSAEFVPKELYKSELYKSELYKNELGDLVPIHVPEALVTGTTNRAEKQDQGRTNRRDYSRGNWRPRRRDRRSRRGQPDPPGPQRVADVTNTSLHGHGHLYRRMDVAPDPVSAGLVELVAQKLARLLQAEVHPNRMAMAIAKRVGMFSPDR
jgi:hypothetical protein